MKHLSIDAIANAEALCLHHLIAADDALLGAACEVALGRCQTNALNALRTSADFLYQIAFALIGSASLNNSEVLEPYRFALAKLIEFAAMLPSDAQTVPCKWFGTLAHAVEPTPIMPSSSYGNGGEV
ncbi:MAG: hypothetical protein P0Y65_13905 [Candidatus Devosia phytovorans]|uniref:Uncharacterized protein n=1 Tax=Candidatus Devosia phytovorans TaxID=3121372 RepID=A0AAJ5VS70_9HYPH|nr:hypothetical protein [Devosia sp.]WEK03282.1 MAG: hypothetical protein P0Y65_13905 [Devosia sp.]